MTMTRRLTRSLHSSFCGFPPRATAKRPRTSLLPHLNALFATLCINDFSEATHIAGVSRRLLTTWPSSYTTVLQVDKICNGPSAVEKSWWVAAAGVILAVAATKHDEVGIDDDGGDHTVGYSHRSTVLFVQ